MKRRFSKTEAWASSLLEVLVQRFWDVPFEKQPRVTVVQASAGLMGQEVPEGQCLLSLPLFGAFSGARLSINIFD